MIQQWAERWVGILGGRAIGRENDVRLGSWVKLIAVRLGMLPKGILAIGRCHTPAHASRHSVKMYDCERENIHVLDRRVG